MGEGGVDLTLGLDDPEYTSLTVEGRYFLLTLQDDQHPYDLQPFFQKTPYVGARFRTRSYQDSDDKYTFLGIGADVYVMPDRLSLQPRVGFSHYEWDLGILGTSKSDTEYWQLGISYYIMPNLRITIPDVVYGFLDSDDGDFIESDASFNWLGIQTVLPVGGMPLNIEADIYLDGFADYVDLEFTLYPQKAFGAGFDLYLIDGGDDTFGIHAGMWMGMARAGFAMTFSDNRTTLSVSGKMRF
jgi:hypothetical protein